MQEEQQERPVNRRWLVLIGGAGLLLLVLGWRLFWFLTDDAHIAFRYVSNSILGYGYVWNPPPFRPVEGYTSFLWVVLLDGIWRLTGVQPPDAANVVSLLFSALTLALSAVLVLRMDLSPPLRRHRLLFLAFVLLGIVSNRTFLAWSSSGLETAMFNCFLMLWIVCCLLLPVGSVRWLAGIATAAVLTYLTRPDGVLTVGATLLLAGGWVLWRVLHPNRAGINVKIKGRHLLALTPMLLVPLHLLWRHSFYGAWLPNTYYAKATGHAFWLESGANYALSFIVEYALWFWLALLVAVVVARALPGRFRLLSPIQLVVVLVIAAHWFTYTVYIGGDHFEFRVYSHLIPLLFVSFLWMLNELRARAWLAVLLFGAWLVFAQPIPWGHRAITHTLTEREQTGFLKASLAAAARERFSFLPDVVIAYLRWYDTMQFWLIDHAICMRHQEHKVFYLSLREVLPPREVGKQIRDDGYPVLAGQSVGVLGWVLPYANIIDTYGLNDYVVARNPTLHPGRVMAHERTPPPGYVECFAPNVVQEWDGRFIIYAREEPMTAERIIACEHTYAEIVRNDR
jgi:arabinofuranosyltransferase